MIDSLDRKYQSLKQKITKSILIKFLKAIKVNTKREKTIFMGETFNECLPDPPKKEEN